MNRRSFLFFSVACGSLYILPGGGSTQSLNYKNKLFSPTLITKLYGTYFIVDCWHHRILYSSKVNLPIEEWRILDNDIAGPHSIASNGEIFVAEDTGRNAIKVYSQKDQNQFQLVQTLPNIGIRPHRVLYDQKNSQFLTVCSNDQSLYIFKYEPINIAVKGLKEVFNTTVEQLNGQYTRSITIKDDLLYFVGTRDILCFELKEGTLGKFIEKIELHPIYHGSNDLFFTKNNEGFLTSSILGIFKFQHISELKDMAASNLSKYYNGTPYYISYFDNKLWVPEIREYNAINFLPDNYLSSKNFNHAEKKILFDFGLPDSASIARKKVLPK